MWLQNNYIYSKTQVLTACLFFFLWTQSSIAAIVEQTYGDQIGGFYWEGDNNIIFDSFDVEIYTHNTETTLIRADIYNTSTPTSPLGTPIASSLFNTNYSCNSPCLPANLAPVTASFNQNIEFQNNDSYVLLFRLEDETSWTYPEALRLTTSSTGNQDFTGFIEYSASNTDHFSDLEFRNYTETSAYPNFYPNIVFNEAVGPVPVPPSAEDLAALSESAYSGPSTLDTYQEISIDGIDPCSDTGVCVRVYSSIESDNIVLVIRGSTTAEDWTGANPTFINPTGRPTDTYREYISQAASSLNTLESQFPDTPITLTGHSLGGSIAEILADASGYNATIFNAPGAASTVPYLSAELSPISDNSRPSIIEHYRMYGDLISGVGEHLQDPITLEAPISEHIVDNHPYIMLKPMHNIRTVRESLENDTLISEEFGNTFETLSLGIIQHTFLEISEIPLGMNEIHIPIVDLAVALNSALHIDPENMDYYHFSADPGSPNIRTITFPMLFESDVLFNLEVLIEDSWTSLGLFDELETYDFGLTGVDLFQFHILDNITQLAPESIESFAFSVTFASEGIFNGQVTAMQTMSSVPEPSTLIILASGFISIGITRLKRKTK